MGLISAGISLLGRGFTAARGAFGAAAPAIGRAAPALGAAALGGAAFQGGLNLLDGGAAPGAFGPQLPAGFAGGGGAPMGGFVTAPDGSRVLLSSTGNPVRPQFFLPLGARMPAGSRVVAVSPSGNLIGIRKKAKRRTFGSEIVRAKTVIKNCKRLLKAVK